MRELSVASQVIVSVIPIVGIVMGSVVIFFYILWGHRERTLMINRDLYHPTPLDLDTFSLLAGILLSAVGLTLSVVFVAIGGFSYSLLGGLIPLSIGIGLLSFFGIRSRSRGA
ncbi:MAG TPA: hypothetical protein PK625_02880 [Spirochaetales bacterium]|nr:hypothetical protein [Spirochaetales bacterium]MBP7263164.1 hypothetical protein [Spirochaetia bacterium]HPE36065.1 hypothetical protein [Spirochaetales bacterium]